MTYPPNERICVFTHPPYRYVGGARTPTAPARATTRLRTAADFILTHSPACGAIRGPEFHKDVNNMATNNAQRYYQRCPKCEQPDGVPDDDLKELECLTCGHKGPGVTFRRIKIDDTYPTAHFQECRACLQNWDTDKRKTVLVPTSWKGYPCWTYDELIEQDNMRGLTSSTLNDV